MASASQRYRRLKSDRIADALQDLEKLRAKAKQVDIEIELARQKAEEAKKQQGDREKEEQ